MPLSVLPDKEIASDAFDQKMVDGFKGVREIQSKKITFQEVEANIGANASKGDGEAGDEEEGADASEVQQVINVVHAAKLQPMKLSQKEFATLQKGYWKRLIEALNKDRYRALGVRITDEDDKDSIKHVYKHRSMQRALFCARRTLRRRGEPFLIALSLFVSILQGEGGRRSR